MQVSGVVMYHGETPEKSESEEDEEIQISANSSLFGFLASVFLILRLCLETFPHQTYDSEIAIEDLLIRASDEQLPMQTPTDKEINLILCFTSCTS